MDSIVYEEKQDLRIMALSSDGHNKMVGEQQQESSGDRDWRDLPDDMVGLISERVGVVGQIRMGAVSAGWDRVLSTGFYSIPSQFPWLMVEDAESADILYLDLFSGKAHKNIKIAKCGRLLSRVISKKEEELLILCHCGCRDGVHRYPSIHNVVGNDDPMVVLIKIIPCNNSSRGMVILLHSPSTFAFARAGDPEWTRLEGVWDGWDGERHDAEAEKEYIYAELHRGCIYVLRAGEAGGVVGCWDITTTTTGALSLSRTWQVDITGLGTYMVASDAVIVIVNELAWADLSSVSVDDSNLKILGLDFETNTWKRIWSLGGGAIFLNPEGALLVDGQDFSDPRLRDRILLTFLYVPKIYDPRCSPSYLTYKDWTCQDFNKGATIVLDYEGAESTDLDTTSIMLSYNMKIGKYDPHHYTWCTSISWEDYGWLSPGKLDEA